MDNVSNRAHRPQPRVDSMMNQQHAGPAPAAHHATPQHSGGRYGASKRKIIGLLAALVIISVAVAGYLAFGRTSTASVIDGGKYQAVFFTNGQVYFGKLSPVNDDYMRLKNVYYLQNKTTDAEDASPQSATAQDASNVELIKLGNEIHGPEDEMLIAKEQVLFFENLKPAGTVSQTISNYQKNK